jgi:hypothetical protein
MELLLRHLPMFVTGRAGLSNVSVDRSRSNKYVLDHFF